MPDIKFELQQKKCRGIGYFHERYTTGVAYADECLISSRCGLTYDIPGLIGGLWKYVNGQHAHKFAVIKYRW